VSPALDFAHPERLWWVLAVPFGLLLVSAIGARRRALAPRLASVLVRTALVAIPAFVLAGPLEVSQSTTPARLDVVIDASRSVAPAARARALDAARAWTRGKDAVARIAAFGERARLVPAALDGGGAASRALEAGDLASDPNPAIALLALLDPPGADPAVVMVTDGAVLPPAEFVAPRGKRPALVVPAAASEAANVRLDSVRVVRDQAKPDETGFEIAGSASAESAGVFRVLIDGAEVRTLPVKLAAGPFIVPVPAGTVAPGRHVAGIWFDGGDAEPFDDELGAIVDVPAPPTVIVVAPEGRSLLSSALKVQGIDHALLTPPDVIQTPALLDRAQVLVLDRMAVEGLSAPEVLSRVSSLLARGGGLLFVPRENPGELVPGPGRKFLELLPFVGRPLEPKKEEPPPKKPPPEKEGLKPPEPEKKKVERRPAPSLGLLLLIDCSSSMRGQSIRLAKEAAIAASEALHPEDKIGVIAFNDEPLEVLAMTRAAEREEIIDRISRIRAEGGTDFGPALDFARAVFREESLQIKHCVLLSDGYSRLGRINERVEKLAREGVTLSTVGIGADVDVSQLSEMAARGHGKYNPAYSADALPQIITVEATRIVASTGARKPFEIEARAEEPAEISPPDPPAKKPDPPPPPEQPPEEAPRIATPLRAEWPAPYLKGVHPELTQGIFEWHRVDPAPHAWVSLATKAGDPLAVHAYAGFGRLVAFAVPLQGAATGPLVNWDDYANFAGQVVRFLTPASRPERLQVRAVAAGRAARLEVVDVERKPGLDEKCRFELRDQRGRPVAGLVRRAGSGVFEIETPSSIPAAFVDVTATVEGEPGSGVASFAVGRPPEIDRLGADLPGLERWASALGGRVVPRAPGSLDLEPAVLRTMRPQAPWWLLLILPLLLLDLLIKRLSPGSFA
jgi:hypothetical protein